MASMASGLAMASRLRTGRPLTASATASSTSLPLRVRGRSSTATTTAGTWRGDSSLRMAPRSRGDQLVVERHLRLEAHGQHDADVAVPLLAEDERLGHLGVALHQPVEVGRADADTTGVERGVAATVDDDAAVVGPRGEVTLAPGAGEPGEVRVAVAGADLAEGSVTPEAEGHRRERRRADQLAGARPGRHRRAVLGPDVDGHAERRPLDLTGVDRAGGVAADQAAAEVRAPGDRRQVDVGLHVRRTRSGSPRATAASRWSRSCAGCAARGCGPAPVRPWPGCR